MTDSIVNYLGYLGVWVAVAVAATVLVLMLRKLKRTLESRKQSSLPVVWHHVTVRARDTDLDNPHDTDWLLAEALRKPGASSQTKTTSWPRICPCCLSSADAEIGVENRSHYSRPGMYRGSTVHHTDSITMKVPYCAKCKQHVRVAGYGGGIFVLAAVIGVLALVIAHSIWFEGTSLLLFEVIYLVLVGTVGVWLVGAPKRLTSHDCASVHAAVGVRNTATDGTFTLPTRQRGGSRAWAPAAHYPGTAHHSTDVHSTRWGQASRTCGYAAILLSSVRIGH